MSTANEGPHARVTTTLAGCRPAPVENPCPDSHYYPSGEEVWDAGECGADACILDCSYGGTMNFVCGMQSGLWCEDCTELLAFLETCTECIIEQPEDRFYSVFCNNTVRF